MMYRCEQIYQVIKNKQKLIKIKTGLQLLTQKIKNSRLTAVTNLKHSIKNLAKSKVSVMILAN